MENNVINLADRRKKPVAAPAEEAMVPVFSELLGAGLLPKALYDSMAKTQADKAQRLAEQTRLSVIARTFAPSTLSPLENPLLVPLFDIKFQSKTLRDVFVPYREALTAREYDDMMSKLGIYFYIDFKAEYFDIWVVFNALGVGKIRKAYEKHGLDWIQCIAKAAVSLDKLNFDTENPDALSARLQIPTVRTKQGKN